MKTPRQILLERHRATESKLDALRAKTLTEISRTKAESREEKLFVPVTRIPSWREIFLSLRWHLAGMGAAWLFVLLLNSESSSVVLASAANESSATPRQLALALRENRRQIAELIESSVATSSEVSVPHTSIPSTPPRRSQFQTSTEMA